MGRLSAVDSEWRAVDKLGEISLRHRRKVALHI